MGHPWEHDLYPYTIERDSLSDEMGKESRRLKIPGLGPGAEERNVFSVPQ